MAREIARYEAVIGNADIAPAEGLGRCATLSDPYLAGDCALQVVTVEAHRPNGRPDRWCDRVPAGVWRDECWFVSAESWRRRRDEKRAAALCTKAGVFKNDCGQHLWQNVASRLARGGPSTFARQLPQAERLYDHWAPMLAASTDFDDRFWLRFYQAGFESVHSVDLSWCDALPADAAKRCVHAGKAWLQREIGPRLDRAHARDTFCALSAPTIADVNSWVAARPDPRLDAVVAERHVALCTPGVDPVPPDAIGHAGGDPYRAGG